MLEMLSEIYYYDDNYEYNCEKFGMKCIFDRWDTLYVIIGETAPKQLTWKRSRILRRVYIAPLSQNKFAGKKGLTREAYCS